MKQKLRAKIVQEFGTQYAFCAHIKLDPPRLSGYLRHNISLNPEEEKAIWEGLGITEKEFRKLAINYKGVLDVRI